MKGSLRQHTASLVILLALGVTACESGAIAALQGEKCYHIETAEILSEVVDSKGDLWKVEGLEKEFFDYKYMVCAVPMDAMVGQERVKGLIGSKVVDVLYVRDRESQFIPITVEEPYRGMYTLDPKEYEWR